MSMDVDGEVWEPFADGTNKKLSGLGLEQTSHVFDGEDIEVVLERVLRACGVGDIARIANGGLDNTACFEDGVDTEAHVLNVVERIENTENVHAGVLGLGAEVVNDVIGVRGVADGVGATQEHLEGNVGHELTQPDQAVPWILIQEAHCHVKGGTAPAFERIGIGEGVCGRGGDMQQI
ncbi:hypothetical protein BC937DRAFT_91767 [Endogone sp. FLAS-F59071]|nr:hypothetical protein BC937DRAFT_91767 [Endogone sp. FLAS-F59071]|eukprot:RUS15956.1 hypothetical protein BC937DRAFT_91767 [Endogone sp. FLAS-F59071]